MADFLQSCLLLLCVLVSTTYSASVKTQGTLLCSVRNRDPCTNFPDLCTGGGAKCRVKGPCEYECVCLTESKECTGAQLLAPASSDTQQVESESLLFFPPDLFKDPIPGPKAPVNSTSAPTPESTTTTTTPSTTPSTTSQPTTSSTTSTSTLVALAAMIERQTVMAKALQDVMKANAQRLENKATNEILFNNSDIAINASSASSPEATQKGSVADDPSNSPKQEIKQIFENIKSSFQLLATHILGAENGSTSTTPAPPPVLTARESSEAPLASVQLSSSTSTIIPTSSDSQTELKTA